MTNFNPDIINEIEVIIFLLNSQADIVYANAQAERFFGKPCADFINQPFLEALPSIANESELDFFEFLSGISNRKKTYFRGQYFRQDGSIGCIEWFIKKIFNNDLLDSIVITGNDITGYSILEDFIAGSRNRLSFFLKNIPMGIIEMDISGKMITANPEISKMMGYENFELIGKNFKLLLDETDRTMVTEILKETTGVFDNNISLLRLIKKNRSLLSAQIQFSQKLGENNSVIGLIAFISDITAALHVEKEITTKKVEYRTVLETGFDAIIFYRVDGHIIDANTLALKKFGLEMDELLQSSIDDITDLYEKFDKTEIVTDIVNSGNIVKEVHVKTRNGTLIPVLAKSNSIHYGEETVIISVFRDLV